MHAVEISRRGERFDKNLFLYLSGSDKIFIYRR